MIVYCDTSALLKLYVAGEGSALMGRLVAGAASVATARLSWVEAHAAMARKAREDVEDAEPLSAARAALHQDWPRYVVMELTRELTERAADYAETFSLRAYDSVQLASAALLVDRAGNKVTFACFDRRLNKAAEVLRMQAPCG